jgi:hypothetical protein
VVLFALPVLTLISRIGLNRQLLLGIPGYHLRKVFAVPVLGDGPCA